MENETRSCTSCGQVVDFKDALMLYNAPHCPDCASAEIETLKRGWLADPCWDIEETEGFEMCAEELKKLRQQTENAQRLAEIDRKENRCFELGISDPRLLDYLESLEWKIALLTERIEKIEE